MRKILSLMLCFALLISIASCSMNQSEKGDQNYDGYQNEENEIAIGSTVFFGSYEQDNNYLNGSEKIEWIVLDEEDNKLFLLSKCTLDEIPFNSERIKLGWDEASIRQWLNNDFKSLAFQEDEQAYICSVTNTNNGNIEHGTSGCADTDDEIFLLSEGEFDRYLSNTAYAEGYASTWLRHKINERNPRIDTEISQWGLRTVGCTHDRFMYVETDGELNSDGGYVDNLCEIRPAMWIEKGQLVTNNIEVDTESAIDISLADIGDYVKFGRYEQDNDDSNGTEDIEWLVISKENNSILLISKYCLDGTPFNNEYEPILWENCSLRSWLNNDFLETAFDSFEQSMIMSTVISNVDYSKNSVADTEDRIFVLSVDEAEAYFRTSQERIAKATTYAQMQKDVLVKENGEAPWWLRTPGGYIAGVSIVDSYGNINDYGSSINSGVSGYADGVRPALWITT